MFQATSAQLNSRLELNDIHPIRANDILHLLDEMYDDDVPSEESPRTPKAEAFEEPTCIPMSGPSNASRSSSISGPQVEGETIENISSIDDQTTSPEQVTKNVILETTEVTPTIPSQDQQPSTQSTNIPVTQEGISHDQSHRITKWTRSHPQSQIIGDPSDAVKTRATIGFYLFSYFVSMIEPKKVSEALEDQFWIEAMQDELFQFERNRVWNLYLCQKVKFL